MTTEYCKQFNVDASFCRPFISTVLYDRCLNVSTEIQPLLTTSQVALLKQGHMLSDMNPGHSDNSPTLNHSLDRHPRQTSAS